MRKPLGIQKCDSPTYRPTDLPTHRHGKFQSRVSAIKNSWQKVQINFFGIVCVKQFIFSSFYAIFGFLTAPNCICWPFFGLYHTHTPLTGSNFEVKNGKISRDPLLHLALIEHMGPRMNILVIFWAAALKGPMTFAFTQGKFLLLLLPLLLCPPWRPKSQLQGSNPNLEA